MNAVYSYSVVESDHRLGLRLRAEGDEYLLEVTTGTDEVGLLFRLCAVLFAHGCQIRQATIATAPSGVHDEFRIRSRAELTEVAVQNMLGDFRALLFGGLSVLGYLRGRTSLPEPACAGGEVDIAMSGGVAKIEVTTPDQPGLLLSLAQAFYVMEINIAEARITTGADGRAQNTFHIAGTDHRFQNSEFRRRLGEELTGLL